jgi:hypothetical protein
MDRLTRLMAWAIVAVYGFAAAALVAGAVRISRRH